MTLMHHYSHGSIQGARETQEDSFGLGLYMDMPAPTESQKRKLQGDLLVVCDGMGGHAGGSVASNLVNQVFYDSFLAQNCAIPDGLLASLHCANQAIADHIAEEPETVGMGTTLVAAVIVQNKLYWISVGDSPLWLLRGGVLTRLNQDHSMAPVLDKMVALGEITAEDAQTDAGRHHLRAAIMGEKLELIDLPPDPFELRAGDVLVLATDGVETLDHDQITGVLETMRDTPSSAASALLSAVESQQNPDQDNATCLVTYSVKEKKFWNFFGIR